MGFGSGLSFGPQLSEGPCDAPHSVISDSLRHASSSGVAALHWKLWLVSARSSRFEAAASAPGDGYPPLARRQPGGPDRGAEQCGDGIVAGWRNIVTPTSPDPLVATALCQAVAPVIGGGAPKEYGGRPPQQNSVYPAEILASW